MVDEVINREVSNSTAMVVGMVLLWSLLANYLQRFNNSYWFISDSMCRWTLGTIERRCGVTVLVKPLTPKFIFRK
jgi:hypothetical protein